MLDLWSRAGLSSSKDSALYDYLWSKVKREKGAIEIKANILERALKNDSLSGSLLKRLAKSSPKRLKRMITKDYSEKISSLERTRDRVKRSYDADNWEEMTKHFQEKIDKIEAKAMLFVDCTDYTVVDNLLDCLSRDNLPWLMPSASKHHWLSDRLQRKISD